MAGCGELWHQLEAALCKERLHPLSYDEQAGGPPLSPSVIIKYTFVSLSQAPIIEVLKTLITLIFSKW